MRSKYPLVLMEQVIMVLVFALSAALCLQVFVFSDQLSRRNEAVDRAVLVTQNAAETLKATGLPPEDALSRMGGTDTQEGIQIRYDRDWAPLSDAASSCSYVLEVTPLPSHIRGLAKARLCVFSAEEDSSPLFELTAAWQEVDLHG